MIALQVDVFDKHQSQIYPIVRHIFYAPSRELAEDRMVLHTNADAFLSACYQEGGYNGLACRVESTFREVEFDVHGVRL